MSLLGESKDQNASAGQAAASAAGDKPQPSHSRMAIRSWRALVVFLLITSAGLAADLWSKHAVFDWLLNQPGLERQAQPMVNRATAEQALRNLNCEQPVLWKVKFTLSMNPGVVFGWAMPPTVVTVVSIITIALVFLFFATGDRRAWSMHIGLACIMAGALGNLYDRLAAQVFVPAYGKPIVNQVRDFINLSDIHIGSWSYQYIFNVADVLLVIGVLLLIVNWWVVRKHEKKPVTTKP